MCEVNLNGWATATEAAAAVAATVAASTSTTVTTSAFGVASAAVSDNIATAPTSAAELTKNAAAPKRRRRRGGASEVTAAALEAAVAALAVSDRAAIGLNEEATATLAAFTNCKAYKTGDAIELALGMEPSGSEQRSASSKSGDITSRRRQANTLRNNGGRLSGQAAAGCRKRPDQNFAKESNSPRRRQTLSRTAEVSSDHHYQQQSSQINQQQQNSHLNQANHEPMNLSRRVRHSRNQHLAAYQQQVAGPNGAAAAASAAASWLQQLSPEARGLFGCQASASVQTVVSEHLALIERQEQQRRQQFSLVTGLPINAASTYLYSTNQTPPAIGSQHQSHSTYRNHPPSAATLDRLAQPGPNPTSAYATQRQAVEALQFASLHSLSAVASALQQQQIFQQHHDTGQQGPAHRHLTQLPGQSKTKCLTKGMSSHPGGGRRPRELRKCRRIYGIEQRTLWCTQCKWKKACSRFCDPNTNSRAGLVQRDPATDICDDGMLL